MHVHAVTVLASQLNETTPVMLQTGPFPVSSGGHTHVLTLSLANLATIKGGGSVTVTSEPGGPTGSTQHTHVYMISCH